MRLNFIQKHLNALFWLIPISLALLLAPLAGTRVSPDGSGYLAQALNFYIGKGYTYADWSPVTFRGPVFSYLLSLTFHLFGVSVFNAMILVRTFFVLNIGIIYLWGQKIGGRFVGALSALLVLTSFSLHRWSARVHLDIVMPFFILAALYTLYSAFEKKKWWLFALSGILLGMAILTKEIAVLFLPMPILLWLAVHEFRSKKNWPFLFVCYVLALLIIVPWGYRLSQDPQMSATFLRTTEWVLSSGVSSSSPVSSELATETVSTVSLAERLISLVDPVVKLVSTIESRVTGFYTNFLSEQFLLAPLFALAWAVTLVRCFSRHNRKENIFLWLSLLCFMPILLFLGAVSYRAGQAYYFYLLSYIAIAYQLYSASKLTPWPRLVSSMALLVLISLQVFVGEMKFAQLFTQADFYGYNSRSQSYTFGYFQDKWTVSDWHAQAAVMAGEWLRENTKPDDAILSDWQWLESYYFYAGGRQPIYEIENFSNQLQRNPQTEVREPIYFIWTQAGRTDPNVPASNVLAFSETHFLSQVRTTKTTHVIIGQRRNFLSLYLRSHPSFVEVAEFGDGRIQIFKVLPNRELQGIEQFPLFTSNRLGPYLAQMRSPKHVEKYNQFKQTYLSSELDLSSEQIKQLEGQLLPTYRYNSIISNKRYASIIKQVDPALLIETINIFEQQALNLPLNPWVHLSLAQLHSEAGERELAQLALTEAISAASAEPTVYPALVDTYSNLRPTLADDTMIQSLLVNLLEEWVADNPDQLHAYWHLAEVYELIGDWSSAMSTYERVLAIWPQSAKTMLQIAEIYRHQKRFEDARSAYETVLQLTPDAHGLPSPADIHVEIGKTLIADASGEAR